jgi:hypothetical protein
MCNKFRNFGKIFEHQNRSVVTSHSAGIFLKTCFHKNVNDSLVTLRLENKSKQHNKDMRACFNYKR